MRGSAAGYDRSRLGGGKRSAATPFCEAESQRIIHAQHLIRKRLDSSSDL